MPDRPQRVPRIRKRIAVKFGPAGYPNSRGFTINVSSQGMAISTNSLPKMAVAVHLEFILASGRICRAEGQVMWVQRGLGQAGTLGVRLQRADEEYYQFVWKLAPPEPQAAVVRQSTPPPVVTPEPPVVPKRSAIYIPPPTRPQPQELKPARERYLGVDITSRPPDPPPSIVQRNPDRESNPPASTKAMDREQPSSAGWEERTERQTVPDPAFTTQREPEPLRAAEPPVEAAASPGPPEVLEQLPDYLTMMAYESATDPETERAGPSWWMPPWEADQLAEGSSNPEVPAYREPRLAVRLPIQFGVGVALDREGTTLNLSATGLALAVPTATEPGEMVVFAITGKSGVSRGAGMVVWVREVAAEPPETCIGVKLIQGDSRYRMLIESLAQESAVA